MTHDDRIQLIKKTREVKQCLLGEAVSSVDKASEEIGEAYPNWLVQSFTNKQIIGRVKAILKRNTKLECPVFIKMVMPEELKEEVYK